MKSNKTNLYVFIRIISVVYKSGAGHPQPCFIPDKSIFIQKIFYTFGQCVIAETPYNPGVFYISRKSALAARRGMCSTQASHPNFNHPTTSLNHPILHPKIPKNRSITTSMHLRKVLYFQQLSASQNPTIPSNHPKIPLQNHKTPNKINSFSNKN